MYWLSKKVVVWPRNEEETMRGFMERFKFLIGLGLDPIAEDARQRTSLDIAAACGNIQIVKLFKRKLMEDVIITLVEAGVNLLNTLSIYYLAPPHSGPGLAIASSE